MPIVTELEAVETKLAALDLHLTWSLLVLALCIAYWLARGLLWLLGETAEDEA